MPPNPPQKSKRHKIQKARWLLRLAAIFFVLIFLITGAEIAYGQIYKEKIFPGIKINSTELGEKTKDEAQNAIQKMSDELIGQGITFYYGFKKVNINPIIVSPTDPDLAYEIMSFDINQMANEAFLIGHQKSGDLIADFINNINDQIKTLIWGNKIDIKYKLDEKKLEEILKENFSSLETPTQDAQLKITFKKDQLSQKPYKIEIVKEQSGQTFDYGLAILKLKNNINLLKIKPIELSLLPAEPKIFEKDFNNKLGLAEEILDLAPITLNYKKEKWVIDQGQLAPWLQFQLKDGRVIIGLNKDVLTADLESIAKEINVPALDAKFEITNGKVTQFQGSQNGLELDIEENFKKINDLLADQKINKIELVVQESFPKIPTEETNNLGIKEIIGTGKSNFSGSPTNRRKNIRVGANKINGILIKPGEEFSLLGAIGEVNEETGFLPELVIKGDRTIPEFGGGLCQIGTTTFRAALDAGLPITERQNHSYRVVYYEPAGTDATIYNPRPDLKFINDTKNYIIFVTKISGDNLIFEFWGTKDGRQVEMTKPNVWNITKPPPMKEIKTTDLPPGEKKCTEKEHNGADAQFTRTITYPNSETKKEIWKSHYKPWQAVCLIGVKPEELESSTDSNTELNPDSTQVDTYTNSGTN